MYMTGKMFFLAGLSLICLEFEQNLKINSIFSCICQNSYPDSLPLGFHQAYVLLLVEIKMERQSNIDM